MNNETTRRDFLKTSSLALAAGAASTLLGNLPKSALAATASPDDRFLRHRFGVNYVPSKNWYFCWNDWKPMEIARDLDRIAEIGADHIRIMVLWPWFQPNPAQVSSAHLDRLESLFHIAAERNLDVLATLYTGWLSGFHFNPPYLEKEPFYTSPKWRIAQELYLTEISRRLVRHKNFLGYDIGNEICDNWNCPTKDGDAWMKAIFAKMESLCPGHIFVNGVDQRPWFREDTFSPQALMAAQKIVTLHCWPFWTGAKKYGGHRDTPYTQLPGAMAALARSYGKAPHKPIWLEEFGACSAEMPEADVPKWMEMAITGGVKGGISWFTWWASHDVNRKFEFNEFEYTLGLMTVENKIKEQGLMFKRLAETYRNKPVIFPEKHLPPPPRERTDETTWEWLLDWMEYTPKI
jgi:endo-1,4-beta-mannosidase